MDNAPIKRHSVTEWIKKQDTSICCLQETHLKPKDMHRLKVKGWKKIFHANNKEKKSRCCSTSIRQNRLQNKENNKRQRRTSHNDKEVSSTRGYNHYKYI